MKYRKYQSAYLQLLLSPAYNETVSLREGEKSNQTTASLDVKRTKMNESVERGCKKNKMWTNCADCELKCDEDEFVCFSSAIKCHIDLPIVECPILEEFNECGTACEETCSNFGQPIICTQECVPGCFCKKGYVRENKAGCCVPSELCGAILSCGYNLEEKNKTCGPNQEYRRCGTACPQTCDGIPENCIQKCVSGCFCKNGFVMDLDRCIPEISCHVVPRDCRENEIYRKCGSPCQELCGEQKKENCNQCVEGCFCKLGYVVEEKAGVCVKPEQCIPPKYTKCPGNETFTYCGGCEGTCQNQFTDCPEECGSPRCECLANRNYSMLPHVHVPKRLVSWPCYFGARHGSSATSAPVRIYSQRHLFEVKKAMLKANNPDKYALASDFLAHRADRPKDYKPDIPPGRTITPSLLQKRLLVLTRMYKSESDIPESINEIKIAIMKERLNFVASIFYLASVLISFSVTIRTMNRVKAIVVGDS
ncbi:unnamed protein product [Litomosoides sigmodontis]|uniref:TIL domain-containing protein n=1 Tax=Litomosoides sigmodontis TaxID=42156 RepID=A0A3P6T1Z5_LITSI|nr:unnamed protein product [Litomosoides sigmodontis]